MENNGLDQATNFALDFQGLMQSGKLNKDSLQELVDRYGPTKDGMTFTFTDGSSCTWSETDQSWTLSSAKK